MIYILFSKFNEMQENDAKLMKKPRCARDDWKCRKYKTNLKMSSFYCDIFLTTSISIIK